ncbi:MAG: transposase, partial [Treponema sp.]|nr:transposase [Treponema sp.]
MWFNLADEAVEEQIYDSYARKFMGLDYSREGAPDATTLLNYRHVLEQHGLSKQFFERVNKGTGEDNGRREHTRCNHHRGSWVNEKRRK